MADETLDRLMTTLAVHLHGFAVCRVEPGWRLRLGRMDQVTIHYVLEGHGAIRLEQGAAVSFGPRSVILVPAGQAQALDCPDASGDGPAREVRDEDSCSLLADGLMAFRAGRSDAEQAGAQEPVPAMTCVCGAITASFGGALGLLDGLRNPILVATEPDDPLGAHFDHMLTELASPAFGTRALTEALMKVCLVTILRRQLLRPAAAVLPVVIGHRDPPRLGIVHK